MISAQIESFEKALPELIELFPGHWEELAIFKDRMPLSPQYAEYIRREQQGLLFLATVRKNGKIVGYYTAQIAPGFHYKSTLTATMDMAYIVPGDRQRGLALPLFRAVERELRHRGVAVWYSGYKTSKPLGMPGILDLFGFSDADTYRAKWLG